MVSALTCFAARSHGQGKIDRHLFPLIALISKSNVNSAPLSLGHGRASGPLPRSYAYPRRQRRFRRSRFPLTPAAALGTTDGGVINGRPGELKRARAGTDPLEVTFEVGTEPGVYRLRIDHHGESQSIEFWIGPESPQGPARPEAALHRSGVGRPLIRSPSLFQHLFL